MLMTTLFFIGAIGVIYSYFLYPLILLVLPKRNIVEHDSSSNSQLGVSLSFIITAFNEEKHIERKILNTLEAEYPQDKLEIIVASDGSTDRTNEIALSFKDKGIKLVKVSEQKGKENAQKEAIAQAKGEILIFSDASTKIEPNALKRIAENFINPKIGAVSSEDRFISNDGSVAGEGAYVKYEMWLRKLEGSVHTLVGLSGSFFAARKEVCENWDISVPSDFNTALNCADKNFVAVSDPKLLGFYPNISDETKEYQRKLRTVIRGIAALASKSEVLNPTKFGLFSFQVFSHKLMRWMVPWFLLLTGISNILLWNHNVFFKLTLIAQISFYFLAALGHFSAQARNNSIIKICYFFVQVNIAIAHATIQFLSGKRVTRWAPSKR